MAEENKNIAIIIPAYNEEATVADVVKIAKKCGLAGEVIVVSDGSTDKTAQQAKEAGADRVLDLQKNMGKGMAMMSGVRATSAGILVFLDADVYGLTPEHIERMVNPVLRGKSVMIAGIIDRGKFISDLAEHMPLISGERALKRFVVENIPEKYLRGFKIETAMNYFCRSRHLPYGHVVLDGVNIKRKMEKVGFFLGLWQYVKMSWEIIAAMFAVRWAHIKKIF